MGVSKPVTVGSRKFAKQRDALDFFKKMLNRYRPGDKVSTSDTVDLTNLLMLHQNVSQKIGVGVAYFEVMSADYGTQCFQIVRNDGSRDDFTYIRCITQRW